MSKPNHSGFTLVELMITVAVIAILAAIALPSYQDFTIRTKVTECLTLSSEAKVAVSEEVGRVGNVYALANSLGGFESTRYCGDISVSDTGEIVMTTQNTGAGDDPVLQLTPIDTDGSIRWSCGLISGSARHVPAVCREAALASNLPVGSPPQAPTVPTPPWTPPPSGGGTEPAPPTTPPADPPPAGSGPTPPPSPAPTNPVPPSNPPPAGGDPQPAPPTDPPASPDPTPPPAGAPPISEPPDTLPPGKHSDYKNGSKEWCLLHPKPPKKCNAYK